MPSLQTMAYLGRLGLVPRKKNKERVAPSLPPVLDLKETRRCTAESANGKRSCQSFGTSLCATKEPNSLTAQPETAGTHQAGLVEIQGTSLAEFPRPAPVNVVDTAFFPRASTSGQEAFIDIEFMEYEQHVQARGHAHNFGAPGGRHAWKTLIFWKRRRTMTPTSGRLFGSASLTPLHHPTFQAVAGRKSYQGSRRSIINPAMVPLYMNDGFSTPSVRAWWEPMVRSGKVSMAGRHDAEFCNMSPYAPLATPSQRIPAAPLYVV